MRISDLSSGTDINKLKQLLASGAITQDDLNQANISGSFGGPQAAPQNALASMANPQPSAFGMQDNQRGVGDQFGSLDHELYTRESTDRLSPEELMMKDALAAQQGDPDALSRVQNALKQGVTADKYGELPKGNNFVKNETTGLVTYLTPQGLSDKPSMGAVIQAPKQSPMQVTGYVGENRVQMGTQAPGQVNVDYSQPPMELLGGKKAYYSKDEPGVAYVMKDGQPVQKVLLRDQSAQMAYDKYRQAQALQDAQLTHEQAATAHTYEQIAASQAARNQKEGIPGAGIPQSILEKQYGKAPQGQRWTPDGKLEDIPGGSGKALTESQGKAAGLASRAEAAHQILTDFEAKGVTTPSLIKMGAEGVPLIGGALGTAVNSMRIPSAAQNQVEQAQRDFVNAALRVESGASISQSEFDNARKQYFPQPGDTPDVIKAKQLAREREIRSLAIQAGPGAQSAGVSTKPISDPGVKAKAIFEAKNAIREGRNKQMVAQRLQSMGVDPREAGL